MNQNERWAVILNLYGERTLGEGVISCAWLPPPATYSAAEYEPVKQDRFEERVVGWLRLANGGVGKPRKGRNVVIRGDVTLSPADLLLPSGTRVYVPGPQGGFLYPAELGTYTEYVGRWHATAGLRDRRARPKVLWSVPPNALPTAA